MRKLTPLAAILALTAPLLMGQSGATNFSLHQGPAASRISAARSEGKLILYSNLNNSTLQTKLLYLFHKQYPFISVTIQLGESHSLYNRFVKEVEGKHPSADIVWTSAMDLQEKLINDGYSQPYESTERYALPQWAQWKGLGYGTTSEPIVFVYNRDHISESIMPRSHAALANLIHNDMSLRGRIAIYDPEKSEAGMLFATQDVLATPGTWHLFDEFWISGANLYPTSADILRHVSNGEQWIGYDVISSDAVQWKKSHPEIEIVFPTDYYLTMTRVALISLKAQHANAAVLFMDFILSKSAQELLTEYGFGSVRADLGNSAPGSVPIGRVRAIRLGPGLLVGLDSLKRSEFLRRWSRLRERSTVSNPINASK